MITYFQELYKENPMEIEVSAPAVISEIAVLKDTVEGNVYLRNIITNVGNKEIIAILISVKLYNVFGEVILSDGKEVMNYIYQDMTMVPGKYWGNKIAIKLPEDTRKVKVHIDKIIFSDNLVWKADPNDVVIMQEQEEMCYSADFYNTIEETGKEQIFFYAENDTCWQCTCGKPNHLDTEVCGYCGRTKEYIKNHYSKSKLEPEYESFLKKKKEKEEIEKAKQAELRRLEEEKRKKEEEERDKRIREKNEAYWVAEEEKRKAEEEKRNEEKKRMKKIAICLGLSVLAIFFIMKFAFPTPRQLTDSETIEQLELHSKNILDLYVELTDNLTEWYSYDTLESDGKECASVFSEFKKYEQDLQEWITDLEKYKPAEKYETHFNILLNEEKELEKIFSVTSEVDIKDNGSYSEDEIAKIDEVKDEFSVHLDDIDELESVLNWYYK